MAKHLLIRYGDHVLYDGPVDGKFTWEETPTALTVTVGQPKPSFLEQLTAAAQKQAKEPETNGSPLAPPTLVEPLSEPENPEPHIAPGAFAYLRSNTPAEDCSLGREDHA